MRQRLQNNSTLAAMINTVKCIHSVQMLFAKNNSKDLCFKISILLLRMQQEYHKSWQFWQHNPELNLLCGTFHIVALKTRDNHRRVTVTSDEWWMYVTCYMSQQMIQLWSKVRCSFQPTFLHLSWVVCSDLLVSSLCCLRPAVSHVSGTLNLLNRTPHDASSVNFNVSSPLV